MGLRQSLRTNANTINPKGGLKYRLTTKLQGSNEARRNFYNANNPEQLELAFNKLKFQL